MRGDEAIALLLEQISKAEKTISELKAKLPTIDNELTAAIAEWDKAASEIEKLRGEHARLIAKEEEDIQKGIEGYLKAFEAAAVKINAALEAIQGIS